MTTTPNYLGAPKPLLEPIQRISELLGGVVMVLTYTTAISVGNDPDNSVSSVLILALGCNLIWGIIDAVLYLMNCMAEKTKGLMSLHVVRNTTDAQEAQRIIAEALPSTIAAILQPAELESMHQRLKQLPEPPKRAHLHKDEWLGALAIVVLVFITTLPVASPFMFMHDLEAALLVSKGIGLVLLFGLGCAYGHVTARNPWFRGIVMVIVGVAMVSLCKALGG